MIYHMCFLLIVIILLISLLYFTYNMMMDLCHIMAQVERTYDIVTKWAIYYVCEEHSKGNNNPFDFIFPNDREEMENQMKQDKCHIDNEKE